MRSTAALGCAHRSAAQPSGSRFACMMCPLPTAVRLGLYHSPCAQHGRGLLTLPCHCNCRWHPLGWWTTPAAAWCARLSSRQVAAAAQLCPLMLAATHCSTALFPCCLLRASDCIGPRACMLHRRLLHLNASPHAPCCSSLQAALDMLGGRMTTVSLNGFVFFGSANSIGVRLQQVGSAGGECAARIMVGTHTHCARSSPAGLRRLQASQIRASVRSGPCSFCVLPPCHCHRRLSG